MDWVEIVIKTLGAIASAVVVSYLYCFTNSQIEQDKSGFFKLRAAKLYAILGWVWTLVLSVAAIGLFWELKSNGDKMTFMLVPVFLIVPGIYFILYHRNHIIYFNEELVIAQSWRKKAAKISWKNIERISYSGLSGNLNIRGQSKKISISPATPGFGTFIDTMERQTKYRGKELKIPNRA